MNEHLSQNYYYSNWMGSNLLRSWEEIIGDRGMVALLSAAKLPEWIENYPPRNMQREFSFDHISRLQTTVEELYGRQCGHGLALRAGRVFFNYILRELGDQIGLNNIEFRLLPLGKKTRRGLQLLADIFNQSSDQQVRAIDVELLAWQIDCCPFCWNRHSEIPTCHTMVGFLQEAVYWINGGKHFPVTETACIAAGDPSCVLTIGQKPIE